MTPRPNGRSTVVRIGAIAAATLVADAGTKVMAVGLGSVHSGLGFVLPIQNPDLSLGLAPGSVPSMLAASALGILIFGSYTAWSATRGAISSWIPGLLVGGGLGNLVDRLLFGAVHDWLDLGKVVVNLADLAILAGLAGLLVSVAVGRSRKGETP